MKTDYVQMVGSECCYNDVCVLQTMISWKVAGNQFWEIVLRLNPKIGNDEVIRIIPSLIEAKPLLHQY